MFSIKWTSKLYFNKAVKIEKNCVAKFFSSIWLITFQTVINYYYHQIDLTTMMWRLIKFSQQNWIYFLLILIMSYWLEFFHHNSPLSTDNRTPQSLLFACLRKPIHLDNHTARADRPRIPNNDRSKLRPLLPYFYSCTGLPARWMISTAVDKHLKRELVKI